MVFMERLQGFHAQAAGGAEQAADRVVAVGQWPTAAVVNLGQLPRRIVVVVAFDQDGFVGAAAE